MAGDSEEEDVEGDENNSEDDSMSAEVYYRIISYSQPTARTGYTAWRHFADPDENLKEEGWSNLVVSLEEHFALGSKKTQHTTDSHGSWIKSSNMPFNYLCLYIKNAKR